MTAAPVFEKTWDELTDKQKMLKNRYFILNEYEKFLEENGDSLPTFVKFAIEDKAKAEYDLIQEIESGKLDHIWS